MWLRYCRLALVVVLVGLPTMPAADKTELLPGWGELTDPDGDCKFKVNKDQLSVQIPGIAHDFSSELMRWNAPRVMSHAKGDFIYEVKVSGDFAPGTESTIEGRWSYNGAGILLIKDKNNYVSLHRAAINLGDKGIRHYANFEWRKGGEVAASFFQIELEAKPVVLRIERRGNSVIGMISYDGFVWRTYQPMETSFPDSLEVGIGATTSSKTPFKFTLEGLSMFHKKANIPPTK